MLTQFEQFAVILQEKYPDLLVEHCVYHCPASSVVICYVNTNYWIMTIYNNKIRHYEGDKLLFTYMNIEDPEHLSVVDEIINKVQITFRRLTRK